ncbi:MAG: MBL fold metallo-hydrolase, partial [Candidatus Methylomirabilales bacterium]
LAVRAEAGGRALVYSADTGPGEGLVELARGAEVMICEAALQAPKADLAEVHLTAEQAGEIAARAGVGRLVLAHLSPGLDPEVSAAQARRRFSGEILLAADNLRIQV